MFKLIKWLIILGIIAVIFLAITERKIGGKTLMEHVEPIMKSKVVREGVRDIRAIVGEGLKAAGEAISEDVTDDERKQLDDLLRKELMEGQPVHMPPDQQALPPDVKPNARVIESPPRRPSVREMEAMFGRGDAERDERGLQEQSIGDR